MVVMKQKMVWENILGLPVNEGLEQTQAAAHGPNAETLLIEAAQSGDLSAFNELVLHYQQDIFGWVVSLVRDEATAEDIAQQTFVTAYQKIHTFRGESLRAWLFRIARNRSFDHLRYRNRHPSVSLEDDSQEEDAADLLSILPADVLPPEDAVIQAEQAARLQQLLDSLPEPFRNVLQLVDMYAMDYQEAAEVLNLPLGTVKSRLARARVKMRSLFEQSSFLA